MCCFLVSGFLTEMTQQIHSFRASGVMSSHFSSARGSDMSTFRKSSGTACTAPGEIAFLVMVHSISDRMVLLFRISLCPVPFQLCRPELSGAKEFSTKTHMGAKSKDPENASGHKYSLKAFAPEHRESTLRLHDKVKNRRDPSTRPRPALRDHGFGFVDPGFPVAEENFSLRIDFFSRMASSDNCTFITFATIEIDRTLRRK